MHACDDGVAGIGKALAMKLARQGLNVVLVALGDALLDSTFEEIKAAHPKQQFRKVGLVWPCGAWPSSSAAIPPTPAPPWRMASVSHLNALPVPSFRGA